MAQTATSYVTTVQRHIGSATAPVVKNFYATAAVSYTKGDFVTIDTAGRVVKNTTNDGLIDGIVYSSVDNTSGANDAIMVPVIVQGNVWVDGIFQTSGTYAQAAAIGTAGAPYGDGGTTAANGQAVLFSSGLTNKKFISLSVQTTAAAGALSVKKMLCYFLGSGKFQ